MRPRAVDSPGLASPGLPEAARRIRIGMPHLDAGGLSENWLFRAAGDLHWEAITRRLGVASHEIETADRHRLYPMVIALRARYGAPLAAVRENDVLTWSRVDVVPCGGACARGLLVARVGEARFSVELLTSFVQRKEDGSLGMALPAARLAARWGGAGPTPEFHLGGAVELAELARAARRGQPMADGFCGPALATGRPPLDQVAYQPSPYADYNGVGLLYFASYVTIAAGAERQMMHRRGWATRAATADDWALATSPVRRDIFFHANLPLGESIRAELLAVEEELDADAWDGLEDRTSVAGVGPPTIKTRLRLRRAGAEQLQGAPGSALLMADVISRHAVLPVRGQRR
jgi:probable biosynthetic protein (TIGR04098 family)